MIAPVFTPEQEARIREIAVEIAVAAAGAQATNAALRAIDQFQVSAAEVEAALYGHALRPLREGAPDA